MKNPARIAFPVLLALGVLTLAACAGQKPAEEAPAAEAAPASDASAPATTPTPETTDSGTTP